MLVNLDVTHADTRDFPGAAFQAKRGDTTLFFGPASGRGRYPLVGVLMDGNRVVLRGTCNYVPVIDAMNELSDPRKQRIREAREALRRAEDELAAALAS